MTRLGVITNPTAGSGRGRRWGAEALTALAARGHQIRDLSRGSWAGAFDAAEAHRRDIDALVVVGGDGMVHLGVQVCATRKLPLGIVAAGSGNDAAIALGLPGPAGEAAGARIDEGLRGKVATVDLGAVTGPGIELPAKPRYFTAVLSAGIDAAVAAYAQHMPFPRGPVKYKVATMREVPRFKPYGVRVEVDGEQWEQECTLVAVANGPLFGGGLIISPASSLVDGKLEVVLAAPLKRREIMKIFPKLYDGSHLDDPRVRVVTGRKITISQTEAGATLPPAFADGELVGAEPLTVTVAPRALRVLGATPTVAWET
ncbi:MAG: diacylglycerol kinase family protein [Demequina sp.]